MTQHFYSNGKLLLSGEYAVLDGALALGLPTVKGQSLELAPLNEPVIHWQACDEQGKIWFKTKFSLPLNKQDHRSTIDTKLYNLLKAAQNLNANFLKDEQGYTIKTTLDFPRDWGLGSSSTLINNIAQWAGVNAHELLWAISKGSGYDIACAQNDMPVTYSINNHKPIVRPVNFLPNFIDHLFFIHLNKKQDSTDGIIDYRRKKVPSSFTDNISSITQSILQCKKLHEFEELITEHEKLIGGVLKIISIKNCLFYDYFGAIKSLGAWGGDFIIATGNDQTPSYFKSRGYNTVIPYNKMIKG